MFIEVHRGGLTVIRARNVPSNVHHGFSTRRGGGSATGGGGLNLGLTSGDQSVEMNWHRFLATLELEHHPVAYVKQVHGVRVLRVSRGLLSPSFTCLGEADGLWTDVPGVVLAVFTADCVPIILHGKGDRPFVMILHGGWRGIAGGLIERALKEVREAMSFDSADLNVITGPSIGACCFEVERQVAEQITANLRDSSGLIKPSIRGHSWRNLGLARVVERVFLEFGVDPRRILICDHCTCCHGHDFYSHRGTRGSERGRMASVVTLNERPVESVSFRGTKPESSV